MLPSSSGFFIKTNCSSRTSTAITAIPKIAFGKTGCTPVVNLKLAKGFVKFSSKF